VVVESHRIVEGLLAVDAAVLRRLAAQRDVLDQALAALDARFTEAVEVFPQPLVARRDRRALFDGVFGAASVLLAISQTSLRKTKIPPRRCGAAGCRVSG
jgi:hypothetical protein